MAWRKRRDPNAPPIQENPRGYLLRVLSSRDYSRAQLEKKLLERGHTKEAIAAALQDFVEAGLYKEHAYTSARIRAFLRKGYGAGWIRHKLRAEKVSFTDEQMDEAYEHLGLTIHDQIRHLAKKSLNFTRIKKNLKTNPKLTRAKIIHTLIAKGHSPRRVTLVVDEVLKD